MAAPTPATTASLCRLQSEKLMEIVEAVPHKVDNIIARRGRIGLIALATDHVIDHELAQLLGDITGVQLYTTRVSMDPQVSRDSLTAMEYHLAPATAALLPGVPLDVIGYGCTSASLLIGEDRVKKIIQSQVDVAHVTTPLTAAKRGLAALGVDKIGYLAPYVSEISNQMCEELGTAGFAVGAAATFGEGRDSVVGCISPMSILEAITALIDRDPKLEAIFVSCTSLKCAPIIARAEARFRIPILSSNSAIAWDMARLAQVSVSATGKGALFLK